MDQLVKVIFICDSIWGKKDEQRLVKYSFSRFLLEKKIVLLTTESSIANLMKKEEEQDRVAQKKKEQSQELFQKLNNFSLFFRLKKNKEGNTFGSIDSNKIIQNLNKCNFIIKKEQLIKFKSIKNVGQSFVRIRLGNEMIANIKIVVS